MDWVAVVVDEVVEEKAPVGVSAMGNIAEVPVVELGMLMVVSIVDQQSIVEVILYGTTILPQQRELLLAQIIPL